jgi:hypothetical protein
LRWWPVIAPGELRMGHAVACAAGAGCGAGTCLALLAGVAGCRLAWVEPGESGR